MTIGNSTRKPSITWLAVAALLLAPAGARAHWLTLRHLQPADSLQDPQDAQDKEQEKRDCEQEARDREQEKRDREEEARDRAQEKLDRLQELYDDGREALDDDHYEQAAAKFQELANLNGPQTDAWAGAPRRSPRSPTSSADFHKAAGKKTPPRLKSKSSNRTASPLIQKCNRMTNSKCWPSRA
jgi:hypothetical protein